VRKNLVSCGFVETINWSFTSLKIASLFTKSEQLLELQNPISAEMQYLRPTLLTGLIANYQKNSAYSFFDCSLFEIGSIFTDHQNQPSIALLQAGNNISDNHLQTPRAFNVFDIKQNLLNVLEIFNLKPESLQLQNQNLPSYYHPHRSTAIFLGKKLLGYFGEIHQYFDLKNRLNVAEIFCQNLPEINFNINHKAYQHNLLPTVERDFSFIAEGSFVIGDILKTITNTDKIYINQVILLDIFSGGKNLTNQQTSLTFRVKIKPNTQTLTTFEIDSISQKIINNLHSNHQLTLRKF
jgi:phenylalanyl-tRNA synthetase beta chain